jgi:hypothetical protein
MRVAMCLAMFLLIVAVACMPRGPVLGGSKQQGVGGTISGVVRASGGSGSLSGRKVTATNVATGQRYEASTGSNGGYTIKVPIGRYRMEVELRAGETLAEQPAETEITVSDMDADRDFIITMKPS